MDSRPTNPDPAQARRVELILQQLDELPTLGAVAVRLLELTAAADSKSREVIELVSSDPALAGKVLAMCRCHERGRANDVTTIDRAVLLLGFDAVRSAVLSVQVFEVFDKLTSPGGEQRADEPVFDRAAFWRHSLAVASLSRSLAEHCPKKRGVRPGEAFIAGLLHDLGTLALHLLLPASVDQVCRFAQTHGVTLDQACRRIIGLDTHTAGKRLAEHWRLPKALSDVLWLTGQRYRSLPDLPHRPLVGVVSLARSIAHRLYATPMGLLPVGDTTEALLEALGIPPEVPDRLAEALLDQVNALATSLGLGVEHDANTLLRSIGRANEALGRLNNTMRLRAMRSRRQSRVLHAIARFHESAQPGQSIVATLATVVSSGAEVLGGEFFATLYQARSSEEWEFVQFSKSGRVLQSRFIRPPDASAVLADLADEAQVSMRAMSIVPWISDHLAEAGDLRSIRLLPLRCAWGVTAVLMHDCPDEAGVDPEQLEALSRTWAAAVAAAAQHCGAKALSEQLAEANLMLVETEESLARSRTMAALGEIAAGAAHEMNNPLAIIAGRSQLLAGRVREPEQRLMAEQIKTQAHRLSDMITALRDFAEPPRPQCQEVNLAELVIRVVQPFVDDEERGPRINTILPEALPPASIDPLQMGHALGELVRNAVESKGVAHIELRVQTDPVDDRLKIQTIDDGAGLTQHALNHAFDPFFSAKVAGRQPGLGLSRARRIVEAHGGSIELANGPSGGAVATIWLEGWRREDDEQRRVA